MSIEYYFIFFLAAILYSSCGHGGASAYLAIFALIGIVDFEIIPFVLLLNILVASISWFNYFRSGFFKWKILFPFVIASIPAAFLGGSLIVPKNIFYFVLSLSLFFSAVKIFFDNRNFTMAQKTSLQNNLFFSFPIGFVIGFISGMIGIGGGIFFSPILLFLHFGNAKEIAAISSAFIVLNSLSGMFAHILNGNFFNINYFPLFFVVGIGGILGSFLGAKKIPNLQLQYILGCVLLIASVKMVLKIF